MKKIKNIIVLFLNIVLIFNFLFVFYYICDVSSCCFSKTTKIYMCHDEFKEKKLKLIGEMKENLSLFLNREYKGPTVSFCTTYRDRFEQISQTLPVNLAHNRIDKENVEFVLIDFDPSDTRLKEFIFKNFSQDIQSGYLKYYQTYQMPLWDFSVAKNTAHYYASNEIVVNLDADNYTGYRGGQYVSKILDSSKNSFLWQMADIINGSYGRISMYKKDFDYLGGYDESLPEPAGYQDQDLIDRALSYLTKIHKNSHNNSIMNEVSDKIKYTRKGKSWQEMNEINREYSQENIKNGKFQVNNGIYGIRNGVTRILSFESEVK